MKMKFNKKSILATAMFLTASALGTLGACAEDNTSKGYTLPNAKTVEVGLEYTPEFSLESNVTAKIVDLTKIPKNSYTFLEEGSFTPDVAGEYTFVVRFTKTVEGGVSETQETVTVQAIDTTAPVISNAISNKSVDVGLYSGFIDDFASLSVRDNCTKSVSVYAESIVFNGETMLLGKDVDSVRLSNIGEYTVNVVAEDSSGNQARTSYKITTSDNDAPVIDTKSVAAAWVKGGKVALPQAKVIDNTDYTLTTAVKNAQGQEVAVVDNAITASVGVYTVTYTAQDIAGNQASKEMKLLVNEEGTISNFSQAGEETLWADDNVRLEDEKLKAYYYKGNEFVLSFVEGFGVGDWTEYVSFEAEFKNNRGSKLSITPYFFVDGAWKETAMQSVEPNASGLVKVYLSDYNLVKVDGVKFVLQCDGGVVADMDEVKVSKQADNRVVPTNYTACHLSAQGAKEIVVNENTKGVVKYTIYSNVDCDIMMLLNYANGSVATTKSLKAGYNEIIRYPDAEAGASLTSSILKSLVVSSFENYEVKLSVSALSYEDISSIDFSAYAITEANYSVGYNETFAIPSPFTSNLRWYKDLTITLKKGNTTVKNNLTIGSILETVGSNALSAGDYTIVYSFKDLAGANKTITYGLTVKQNILTASLTMPALFASDEGFDLPAPELTSAVYGDSTIQNNATVTKYYRLAGRKVWTRLEDGEKFIPQSNKTYEIKYAIEYDGNYAEVTSKKFIHVDTYTLDFEPEDAVGEEMFAQVYRKGGTLPDGTIAEKETYVKAKSRFLYDGGYYDYHNSFSWNRWETSSDWSKSGSTSLTYYSPARQACAGIYIRPIITNDKGINAVQFWMKAEKDIPNALLEIGVGETKGQPYNSSAGWRSFEPFDIKAGEHFYTAFLKEPVTGVSSIGSIVLDIQPSNRLYIDDISFVHIERFKAEDNNTYDDQIDHSEGYEIAKPAIYSEVMTAEQLAKVSFVLTYTLNGKNEKEIRPNADGKYILKLADGEYGEVVFHWVVSTPNVWYLEGPAMEYEFTSPKVVINSAKLDFEHPEIVMLDSDTKLTRPTSQVGAVSNEKVEYRVYGTQQWITLSNDNLSIPTDKVGWLEIRYTADVKVSDTLTVTGFALSEIYVRDPYVLVDFEGSDPFNGGGDYGTNRGGGSRVAYELINDPEKTDKNTVMKFTNIFDGWEGVWFKKAITLEEACDIIYLRVYSSKTISKYQIEIYALLNSVSLGWPTWEVDLQKGWNEVYLTGVEFDTFYGIQGRTRYDLPTIMFDDITLLRIETAGTMPKEINYGEEATLPTMTLKGDSATISYRVKGTETWSILDGTKFKPTKASTYEFRYAFDGVAEFIYDLKVNIEIPALNSLITSVKAGNAVSVPVITYANETAVAFYREAGASDWIPVVNNSFIPEKEGSYEVKFYFEALDLEVIKLVTATPANELLLTNFEIPFDADDKNYTNYGHINTAQNSIRPEGIEREERYKLEQTEFGTSMFILQRASWEGPVWREGVEFGFSTNTFKLKAKGQPWTDKIVIAYAWIWDKDSKSRREPQFTIDFDNAVDLGNGWYEYTLTLASSISYINGFEFYTQGFYIDDIRAIDLSK